MHEDTIEFDLSPLDGKYRLIEDTTNDYFWSLEKGDWCQLVKEHYPRSSRSRDEAVRWARKQLSDRTYDLADKNCEHFISQALEFKSKSQQADKYWLPLSLVKVFNRIESSKKSNAVLYGALSGGASAGLASEGGAPLLVGMASGASASASLQKISEEVSNVTSGSLGPSLHASSAGYKLIANNMSQLAWFAFIFILLLVVLFIMNVL